MGEEREGTRGASGVVSLPRDREGGRGKEKPCEFVMPNLVVKAVGTYTPPANGGNASGR